MVEVWSAVLGVRGRKLIEAPLIRRTSPYLASNVLFFRVLGL
jgi:hypothetical protein